ncbi:MAG TPA: Lipoprotein-releasing system ATP-binding protein LolD 1 [Rhodopirellula baltica]|uniref:Lipoprotein-releasing system ATP-binding protein LolD 1 n=2 Tax=Rhodopirellula TaxID=265488 RepID=LOLD1_RHOBA|nr:ABC transporter ATP-binding protein [Rhodopirellula baltica]Q7UX73.1 RecName: Full=Lipoprotein-releasing system ATP-binding protein LolD 1 [Rhodopirellula baltica SH 1]CAD72136.1 lipoprotein releasing system ATP-binding protein lolD [Rhodopirellula baltica SH 1]HBE66295.1 Lipoprotein-releasing system ATP-binding protein LolD 1 [Rhodopirellula baltica]
MLVVSELSKSYPTAGEPLSVLRGVNLELSPGQSAAIVGPSGSGKTTLLQILGTLDEPDSGSVQINGQDPFALDARERAAYRNQTIGFIFQDHHLLPQLSVTENVLIPALANGKPTSDDVSRAAELIDAVGLSHRATHLPRELSGGERERVAIARALLMQPSVVLADEPTGNLDSKTAKTITELLLRLQAEQNTVLVTVTHSLSLADEMNERFELVDGALVRRGRFGITA